MNKEIPLLFGTPMVQAILAGRKTQTRRILKLKHLPNKEIASIHPDGAGTGWIAWSPRPVTAEATKEAYPGEDGFKCPYGIPGNLLWVRETWFPAAINDNKVLVGYHDKDPDNTCEFTTEKIDFYCKQMVKARMIPSIHMPKEAARIWLEVTDIRVERLQDITSHDVLKEGAGTEVRQMWLYGLDQKGQDEVYRRSFQRLWETINDPESWEANPWVWSISFKVLSTTGKP